uniref:G-protein coupled receptors family 1 profile domain-containing protein n=1 Tax=Megaselia scalaris TaxID=36166 RepID=T1GW43_MEGSC
MTIFVDYELIATKRIEVADFAGDIETRLYSSGYEEEFQLEYVSYNQELPDMITCIYEDMTQCIEFCIPGSKEVIKMLIIVVIVFGVCWLPLQAYNIIYVTIPEINEFHYISIIWFTCDWLAMSNSCYNPFIYGIYNTRMLNIQSLPKTIFSDNFVVVYM